MFWFILTKLKEIPFLSPPPPNKYVHFLQHLLCTIILVHTVLIMIIPKNKNRLMNARHDMNGK